MSQYTIIFKYVMHTRQRKFKEELKNWRPAEIASLNWVELRKADLCGRNIGVNWSCVISSFVFYYLLLAWRNHLHNIWCFCDYELTQLFPIHRKIMLSVLVLKWKSLQYWAFHFSSTHVRGLVCVFPRRNLKYNCYLQKQPSYFHKTFVFLNIFLHHNF